MRERERERLCYLLFAVIGDICAVFLRINARRGELLIKMRVLDVKETIGINIEILSLL